MADVPPSGPPGPVSMRPPLVTGAGVILIVVGVLNIVFALFLFSLGTLGVLYGILGIIVGAAAIWAGLQVLALREQGRTVGLAIAGIGVILGLLQLFQGNVYAIIGLLLNAFIIYGLVTQAAAFRR